MKADFGVKQAVKIEEYMEPGTYVVFAKFGSQSNSKPKIPE